MALNRTLPVPLYYQLAELLAAKIRQGELAPGQQLLAERDLSEQYGISRMTVRQALAYLVAEGTLTTHQGLGTFVAPPKLTANPVHLLGFSEEMIANTQVSGDSNCSRFIRSKCPRFRVINGSV